MSALNIATFSFLTVVLFIAAVMDVRIHKIPNWLTYPTVIIAIVNHTWSGGWEGFLFSIQGVGLGLAILIIPYFIGGMGAGDAKLLGAVGGILGPGGVFTAFLFTALVGGIYAVVLLGVRGYLAHALRQAAGFVKTFLLTGTLAFPASPKRRRGLELYYGFAIALGTFVSVSWKNLI
jgi:prepilin peptidase CpaA